MATIRRVTFHRLRNVKPGCTIELHPGLNVLLGQNGTGKTTLLQWMADCLSGHLYQWDDEPYDVELEIETDAGTSLLVRIHNEVIEPTPRQRLLNALSDPQGAPRPSARSAGHTISVSIETGEARYLIDDQPSHLSFQGSDIQLIQSAPTRDGLRASSASPVWGTILDALSLLHQYPSNVSEHEAARQRASSLLSTLSTNLLNCFSYSTVRFDESLDFFDLLVSGREPGAYVMISRAHPAPMRWFVPGRIGELVAGRTLESPADLQTLTFTSEDVQGFLASATRLFQHRSANIQLALLSKDMRGPEPTSTYGHLRFTFERYDGSIFGHEKLSYGQKRMLSFLYYLALNPRLIIVDELVNGLHHAWIEACIEEIGNRQGILTSQNPLLLDYLTFESPDEVRQRFVLCRSERDDETGREQLIWRNPTQEEAESFFSAYQAGIQHVGEILVDKGFW